MVDTINENGIDKSGINMDEECFEELLDIIKHMEKDDVEGRGLHDTLRYIVTNFGRRLTKEQYNLLVKLLPRIPYVQQRIYEKEYF